MILTAGGRRGGGETILEVASALSPSPRSSTKTMTVTAAISSASLPPHPVT